MRERVLSFAAGVVVGTLALYAYWRAVQIIPPPVAMAATRAPLSDSVLPPIHLIEDDAHALLRRDLAMPIARASAESLEDTFTHPRPGRKTHEAIDIPAARGTPIHALGDGVIRKLSVSARGGITIYEYDDQGMYCFSYAHLDRYANRLHEGTRVKHGDIIGYVGTTGDAPANGPHLHLAIARVTDADRWWEGAPVNPYPVLIAISGGSAEDTH